METIDIFKNVVFQLRNWYIESSGINEEEFNTNNDFNILKLIKLHFFVVAINSDKNQMLLDKNEFWAMPYGPVETTVYTKIRSNKNFDSFILSNNNIHFVNNDLPIIHSDLSQAIMDSINLLKVLEPRLIFADAGTLVDLTHTWNCWKRNYNIARIKGNYSEKIPQEDIVSDTKIINIDLL